MECYHIWDKLTGIRIKGKPWIGLKSKWIRTCKKCGKKEKFNNGPVYFGWYSEGEKE